MVQVTWGTNTTHVFSGSTTPAGGTGTTPTAPFGGAPAAAAPGAPTTPGSSIFGAPAPPPASGGLFSTPTLGSSPAPATPGFGGLSAAAPSTTGTGGSLFGGTPAAATGGLFGTAAAPSTGTSLFGAAPSQTPLFGAPAPSAFGAPQMQPQQQQIPAQAALQAHMDASARQEEARQKAKMEEIHAAYTGAPPGDSKDKVRFLSTVYIDITPEQRQLQLMHTMGSRGPTIIPPPKPPHVSEDEWIKAAVSNPDPEQYMPAALLGAEALRMRVVWQQERATSMAKGIAQLRSAHEAIHTRCQQVQSYIQHVTRTHAALRKRLLDVMLKVEVARCINLHLQQDEVKAAQRLSELLRQVDKSSGVLAEIQDAARTHPRVAVPPHVTLPDKGRLFLELKEQRERIESATKLMQRDMRDIRLLQQHVVQKVPTPPAVGR